MLSANLEKSLHRALALANERNHEFATLEHLLLSLVEDQDALSVLLRHYSKDRIFSDAARTTWCEPDLVPLPIPTAAPVLRSA